METGEIIDTDGWHGTYRKNLDSILNTGFKESVDHNQWYGDGVYFFVKGLGAPEDAALQFAKDKAFKDRSIEEVFVIKATICVKRDSFLDLTVNQGLEFVNSYRDEVIASIAHKRGKRAVKAIEDHHILSSLRKNLGIEFVKGNVHIKFGDHRKLVYFHSVIPNVTIFVVNNATKYIESASINCI